jgi:hypothetical protein
MVATERRLAPSRRLCLKSGGVMIDTWTCKPGTNIRRVGPAIRPFATWQSARCDDTQLGATIDR